MRRSDYLLYTAIGLGTIGLIALYVREFDWFNRTLGIKPVVIGSLLVGALIGLAVSYRLRDRGEDLVGRMQIFVSITIQCTLFAPLFGSLSNRLLSPYPVREERVEFIREEAFYADRFGFPEGAKPKPTGYYLFIFHQGAIRRIVNEEPLFPEQERGDTITLPIRKGLWGVSFVPKRR